MSEEKFPNPTEEETAAYMGSVARQFGEESEEDIVKRYKRDGWKLADVVTNAARVSAEDPSKKQVKIVDLGNNKFLVFEKK